MDTLQASNLAGFFCEEEVMLDHYRDLRTQLIGNIEHLREISSRRDNEKIVDNLNEIREKLIENRFHLVVLGQFKRGKSTFINSIIGDKILPTSVIPLTSIVTILKFGQHEEAEVIFEEGTRRVITRDELTDYVTERGNPKNIKKVSQVEIAFPSAFLKDGVFIIDTPGVGSTFENNTEMTYNYLPKVDAALFLLAVDPPISQSEIMFLHDVRKYVEKIFFIQNKIDYLTPEERRESMIFSKKVIEEALDIEGIHIHPLSAKMALEAKNKQDEALLKESRLIEFDQVLGDFLLNAKGRTVLSSAIRGITRLLEDEELTLKLENRAIAMPLEALEHKISIFREKMQTVKEEREDTKYYFDGEIQRAIDLLDRDLQRLKDREIPSLMKNLEKASEAHQSKPVSEYVRIMESVLHEGVIRTFDDWITHEEERLNQEYARISKRYSDKTNETIQAILDISSELFDLELGKLQNEEAISSESGLYYMTGDPPKFFDLEGAFDYFSKKILPRQLSRKLVLKDLKGKLPQKIDQNCGRVRWDFMERLKKSFTDFRWDLNLKIDATEESIRKAIDRTLELKKQSAQEIAKAEQEMQKQLDELDALKRGIQTLNESIISL